MKAPNTSKLARLMAPVAESLLTAEESQHRQSVRRAIADDGTVRRNAYRLPPQSLTFWLPGNASIANNVAQEIRIPVAGRAIGIDLHAKTWPVGANLTVRVVRNGADTIATVSRSPGGGFAYASANAVLTAGDALRLDVTGVGSATAGANLSVNLLYQPDPV